MIRRVYLVAWWFAEAGGMEQHVANLGCALARRGIDVVVFSQMPIPRNSHYARQLREAGISVIGPPAWSLRFVHSRRLRKAVRRVLWALLSPLIFLERLKWKLFGYSGETRDMVNAVSDMVYLDYSRWLLCKRIDYHRRRRPPDLVHVHGFRIDQAWILPRLQARLLPVMYTEHGTLSDWDGLYDEEGPRQLTEADGIACVSDRSRESLYEYISKETQVEVVPHIIEAATSQEDGSKRERLKSDPVRITCIARLQEEKGGRVLIEAMRIVADRNPSVRLTFAGDGPERASLEDLVRRFDLGSCIDFRGRFAPCELPALMGETDLIVMPSLTEGLPLTLIEAMAFAKPIIATRVGGIPEVIRHGENGLLVEPNSPDMLADCITELAGNATRRDKLGQEAGRSFCSGEYGEEAVIARTLKLYHEAQERSAGKSRGREGKSRGMRILIISNLIPVPANSGGRLRQSHLLRHISKRHDVSYACHLWDDEEADGIPVLKKLCRHVITGRVYRRPFARHIPAMICNLLQGRPPDLAFWRSAELAHKIRKLVSEEEFDIIQIEESFMAPYLDAIPGSSTARKILVFHNIGFDQMSKAFHICSGWKYSWYRFGASMLSSWEPTVAEQFDRCITVSERDRELLEMSGSRCAVDVIPNGIDVESCRAAREPDDPPSFLFVGDMNYEPCIDAAVRFAKIILPRIRRRIPGAVFRIVGREPSYAIRELRSDSVEVTGMVEDVAPYYERCTASVVPLQAGGGTRLKILEAMAFSRPVISTSIGAEGLDLTHGEHLLIADTVGNFADEAVRVARGGEGIIQMIERARRLVELKYDWGTIAPGQLRIYDELSR